MSFSRYELDYPVNGRVLSTSTAMRKLRIAHRRGAVSTEKMVLKEGQRLDQIAFQRYGDARLWWVIAAFSNVGWWLQVPPGTLIEMPINIQEVEEIIT